MLAILSSAVHVIALRIVFLVEALVSSTLAEANSR